MASIKNHPGAFLNDLSAASFERMEAARGITIPVSDFGRTEAYQQNIIDRWDSGDRDGLFEPGRPATASPHVRNGGEAADVISPDARAWIKAHPEYGWSFPIPSDIVHMVYTPGNDRYLGTTTAGSGSTPIQQVIKKMEAMMPVAIYDANKAKTPQGAPWVLIFPGGEYPVNGTEGQERDAVEGKDRNVGGVISAVWGPPIGLNGTDMNTVFELNKRMTAAMKANLK